MDLFIVFSPTSVFMLAREVLAVSPKDFGPMTGTLPTYFISHGGGPWPWMPDLRAIFASLEEALKQMVRDHGEAPKAILMISGHWEEDRATVMGAAKPPMLYDYYGFPPETYEISYPAPGAPEIAARTASLLEAAGIAVNIDAERGFDHGVFAPMEVMYPEANVPLFLLSILNNYDPAAHLAIGRALKPLRDEAVMIVGSGLSFHNIPLMRDGSGSDASVEFDAWLFEAMSAKPEDRSRAVVDWETAPAARICHKEEDHLVPLFVALGAAEQEEATRIYHNTNEMAGITVSNYRFG